MAKINKTSEFLSTLIPVTNIDPEIHSKLLSRVVLTKEGCLEWCGTLNGKGYGVLSHNKNRNLAVHRLFYNIYKGDLKDLHVCHHCDNRCCCNPHHLFLGTNRDNVLDALRKGRRTQNFKPGHKAINAKLTVEFAAEILKFIQENPLKTRKEIAHHFGISIYNVADIKRGRSYRAAPNLIKLNSGDTHLTSCSSTFPQ